MHMSDALLSPAVGGSMWVAAAATIGYCSRTVRKRMDDRLVPLMGVLGAFVFAAQMINFSIPGTGSSGHLGGGLLLAILLGPHAAFLVVASVLMVQALFFADGGLLALGCNIINLGVFPCLLAYPLAYRTLSPRGAGARQMTLASVFAAMVGLQLGALAVVVQTTASGLSDLSFTSFALLMLPIHLAIGLVEGLVTAVVVRFIGEVRPDVLPRTSGDEPGKTWPLAGKMAALVLAAVLTGGVFSWFASARPDGLEWSLAKAGAAEAAVAERGISGKLAEWQDRLALMPDYGFRKEASVSGEDQEKEGGWPQVDAGTSVAGLIGGLLTLIVAAAGALILRRGTGKGA